MSEVPSPCIRNCCLDNNDICLGCFRHIDEIIGWQNKTVTDKKAVIAIAEQRKNGKELQTD